MNKLATAGEGKEGMTEDIRNDLSHIREYPHESKAQLNTFWRPIATRSNDEERSSHSVAHLQRVTDDETPIDLTSNKREVRSSLHHNESNRSTAGSLQYNSADFQYSTPQAHPHEPEEDDLVARMGNSHAAHYIVNAHESARLYANHASEFPSISGNIPVSPLMNMFMEYTSKLHRMYNIPHSSHDFMNR